MKEPQEELIKYWDAGFLASEKDPGSFYDLYKLPQITQSSHYRRMELLDSLPIGDVAGKVCVDYGVGPWGFACIYPRLQGCGMAIGIDISKEAVRMSESKSRDGDFPYGKNFRYLVSSGDEIDLPGKSVDVFFAGEAIEHVENVDAFLDEAYRILKPEGLIILTTPNADALLYKAQGERYCINAEHVSLMGWDELITFVTPRFDVLVTKGFNGSFFRTLDEKLKDEEFARAWSAAFEDRPDLATGVIILARKKAGYVPNKFVHTYLHHSSEKLEYAGEWVDRTLYGPLTGKMGRADRQSRVSFAFEGDGLLVSLWSHDWSGFTQLEVDGQIKTINLYSPVPGFTKVRFPDINRGRHSVSILPICQKDQRSHSDETIFHQAVCYKRMPLDEVTSDE